MNDATPVPHLLTLLDELPGGLALFDTHGVLQEANNAFRRAVGDTGIGRFDAIFGAAAQTFTSGKGEAVLLAAGHHAVSTRLVEHWGWLCQLHDVTPWVEGRAAASVIAARDPLTGLANRTGLLPELKRAVADASRSTTLMMIDLDRFKSVNDTLGHPVGDALLRKVADRLSASLRATDSVARLGGDEFAVLQVGAEQPTGSETLAKRLVEILSRPYVIQGHMIDIGASVGVAIAKPGDDAGALLKQADIALYRAKNAGRGRYTFFEQHMDEAMQHRRAIELDLRRALAFRQFELHYQPQMCIATNAITGMEALIRWRHPERGLVPPNDFIPLAEETGLIVPIGEWVIRQACEDAAGWPGDIPVAVNVSAKQLASGKLVRAVLDAVARAGLPAARLEVEITETVLMNDVTGCVDTLHGLRDLGIKVSMDDFGTGYSSLSYLRSFPFDKIKIDQSFVRSGDAEKNSGIISAITAIGRHLGMSTIAEGVETVAQLGSVTDSGCGSIQGFLISRPVPAGEVAALIARLVHGQPDIKQQALETIGDVLTAETLPVVETGLHRLVYYSRNTIFGLDHDVVRSVDEILAKSQRNNAAVGVTGALMFTDGYFAQVLEGSLAAVEQVFERIQLDDRHAEVQLLSFGPVETRLFPNWAMAFVGKSEPGHNKFGHYAASSGFDFAAADGDRMVVHLRALLVEEEGPTLKIAA